MRAIGNILMILIIVILVYAFMTLILVNNKQVKYLQRLDNKVQHIDTIYVPIELDN